MVSLRRLAQPALAFLVATGVFTFVTGCGNSDKHPTMTNTDQGQTSTNVDKGTSTGGGSSSSTDSSATTGTTSSQPPTTTGTMPVTTAVGPGH